MSKNGHSNAGFVSEHVDSKKPPSNCYSLEMAENGATKSAIIAKDPDYNPYENREVEHPTTNYETLFHLLKGSLGTGILAMPNAFKNAGYLTGSIGTIVIGFICTYCIHQLVKAEFELCRRKKIPSMNYPAVAETAMGEGPKLFRNCAPYIGTVVNTFLLIYQLGTCCVYVVFVASNIKSIVDAVYETNVDVRLCMIIILLPLILINWVRNLKYLAPFSTLANAITMVSFGIICYYIFREPLDTDGKEALGRPQDFPLFFGTVLFALEAIGVILPLENEMKTPKRFGGSCGVLNVSMILIVFLYVGMGLFGYLKYGGDVLGSITLNLPANDILAQCVKGMLAFAIYITHGLACYVAIDITWNDYVCKRLSAQSNKLFWEYAVRTALVLVTFLLAVAIPNLELFISLFGALCLSALGLAFPALIQISTHWYHSKGLRKAWLLLSNFVLIIVGILGLVIGTYTSLKEIVITFSE
ncbi:proton-coupled amino acid transporter-like protein CG1139 [Scaptodrosophila lebanonensis]|uniref:Proton-coupled amino acid transporter-like protein CG1139 n=1 Tax=Drosophila lebanonensis TaxID=7225 RepID=A0A6J2TA61_DROLE|nr:proton-coupled amino acid transporter-like protein CG1139 [Scaptodrosophila lebanonensis]